MAWKNTYKRGISRRPFMGDGEPFALTFDMFELVADVV